MWGTGSPSKEVNADYFSVRWTGKVQTLDAPDGTGTYTFQTTSDEGVRLWVDGQLIIDDWTSHTQDTVDSGQIYLQGGTQYDIRVEYYEGTGNATMQLAWLPPNSGGGLPVVIPKGQLYPPVTQPDGPPPQTGGADTLLYLHADQLGSVGAVTDANHAIVSSQEYDPWGKVLTPSGTPVVPGPAPITQSTRNYTGQKLDGTGLLYYIARYYDPVVGRFTSPDSIVPGASQRSGGAGGYVSKQQNSSLTVDFHEGGFLTDAARENYTVLQEGYWSQHRDTSGPSEPQSLGRYTMALDNPIRYADPTGHWVDPPTSVMTLDQLLTFVEAGNKLTLSAVNSADKFKSFFQGLTKFTEDNDIMLSNEAADAIVSAANANGVDLRLDPPHDPTGRTPDVEYSHLQMSGVNRSGHLRVEEDYDNPGVTGYGYGKSYATRPPGSQPPGTEEVTEEGGSGDGEGGEGVPFTGTGGPGEQRLDE